MSFEAFLRLLIDPHGLQTAVALLLALLVEFFPAFAYMDPVRKRWVLLAVAFGLPTVSVGLGVLTLGWPVVWPGYWWDAIVSGALFFGGAVIPGSTRAATQIQLASNHVYEIRARRAFRNAR